MVDDRAIAGTQFEDLGEAIFLEGNLRVEHLHTEFALRGDVELDGHFEDHVRLAADRPSLGKLRYRRQVGVVTTRRTSVGPSRDRVDLRLRQAGVVPHFQSLVVRAPRRHFTTDDFVLDRARPGPHILVRQQRHRCHFTWPMTLRAVVVNDRCDVLGEGG